MSGADGSASPAERAERLRALHHADRPLVLPNAWDALSARVLAEAGFGAIASTSMSVAHAIGIARVSTGPALALHAMAALRRAADALLAGQDPYAA